MTQTELIQKIERAGMVAVEIELEERSRKNSLFTGDLNQFLKTAKIIGARAVFMEAIPLRAHLFSYDPYIEEAELDGVRNPENEIDLTTICPSLKKYKRRLGQPLWFELSAKGGAGELCLILDQNWKRALDQEIERAQGEAVLARSHRN